MGARRWRLFAFQFRRRLHFQDGREMRFPRRPNLASRISFAPLSLFFSLLYLLIYTVIACPQLFLFFFFLLSRFLPISRCRAEFEDINLRRERPLGTWQIEGTRRGRFISSRRKVKEANKVAAIMLSLEKKKKKNQRNIRWQQVMVHLETISGELAAK